MSQTKANNGGKRSGKVTLKADEQTATIAVSQAGNICPTCNGKGKVKCTKCHGRGLITEYNNDNPSCCTKCGGSGNMYGGRRGSGRMTCPTCGGDGK